MSEANPLVTLPDTDRQYHIDLAPGEIADYILLPGDPDRTDRIAEMLDEIEVHRRHREFNSVTGTHKGLRVSVVATGIGTDNVEIVIAEILAIAERPPTFIRIGSCGALREDIGLGELIITSGAVRLESTTRSTTSTRATPRSRTTRPWRPCSRPPTGPACRPTWAHRHRAGLLRAAGPAHPAAAHPLPRPGRARWRARVWSTSRWRPRRVLTLSALAGCRAGVVCTVFAQRTTGEFVTGEQRPRAEAGLIETGLEALHVLAEMDAQQVTFRREALAARHTGARIGNLVRSSVQAPCCGPARPGR